MKILSLMLCFSLIATSIFAEKGYPKIYNLQLKKQIENVDQAKNLCRECCEQSALDSDGNLIVVHACAGWLLTSCATAHERACDRALAALAAVVPNP